MFQTTPPKIVGDLRVGGISDANKNARVTFLYFIHVFLVWPTGLPSWWFQPI